MIKNFLKNNLFFVLLSGVLLNISFFVHNFYGQIFSFFALIPVFYVLPKIEKEKSYLYGLVFFGSWLIPTSVWYFNVFPWWLAILSMTFFTLMAVIFQVSSIFKNVYLKYFSFIFVWILISVLRYNLPITQNWWIPDLYYLLSFHPFILQIIKYFSIFSLIFLILASNSIIGFLLYKKNYKLFFACFVFVLTFIFVSNKIFITQNNAEIKKNISLIALQNLTSGGIDVHATSFDVSSMLNKTKNIINSNNLNKNIFVLWPENKISEPDYYLIQDFAKNEKINLIFNSKEKIGNNFLNTIVFVGSDGEIKFKNYKKHIAPGEDGFVSYDSKSGYNFNDIKITSGICYDFHYFDISEKLKNNDLAFVAVNDAAFGSNMPYFHLADIVFRAIENDISILSSSTNAPTFFVDKNGIIKTEVLRPYLDSYIIYNF